MVLDNEERQLWDAYRETGDANDLIRYYTPWMIERVKNTKPRRCPLDEAVSFGMTILWGCIERYRPEGPASFRTYAWRKVGYAGLEYIRWHFTRRADRPRMRYLDSSVDVADDREREPLDVMIGRETWELMMRCLREKEALAVDMSYRQGKSLPQIAAVFGVSPSAVCQTLRVAREWLLANQDYWGEAR